MTEELLTKAKERLLRKLALPEPEPDTLALLEDELEDAESALLLYLRWEELKETLLSKVVELAALYYRRDTSGTSSGPVKSRSYSEKDVSQSETYLSAEDYDAAEQALLTGLAKYREVRVK